MIVHKRLALACFAMMCLGSPFMGGCMSANNVLIPGIGLLTSVREGDLIGPQGMQWFWQPEEQAAIPATDNFEAVAVVLGAAMPITPVAGSAPFGAMVSSIARVLAARERRPNVTNVKGVSKSISAAEAAAAAKAKADAESSAKTKQYQDQDQDQHQDQDQDQGQEQGQDQNQKQEQEQSGEEDCYDC